MYIKNVILNWEQTANLFLILFSNNDCIRNYLLSPYSLMIVDVL